MGDMGWHAKSTFVPLEGGCQPCGCFIQQSIWTKAPQTLLHTPPPPATQPSLT